MVNLTKLNEFRARVSLVASIEELSMVQSHAVTNLKSHINECHEDIITTVDGNHEAIEETLIMLLKRSINGVVGKIDETNGSKKKTRG